MRHVLTAALAGALVLSPLVAEAHGPTRKKVTESVEINAPAAKVWAAIGNFQDMSWHPAITGSTGQGGNAIDATRKLTLTGGGTIDEVLYKYEPEKMSYSYRINAVDVKVLPVTNYSSTITVEPIDATHTKVEWKGAFYRGYPNNDPPPELNDDAAVAAVTAVYRGGLDALKAKLEKGPS
ncbi:MULTISPECIES: SRPBCC family protein [Xanthobacter]|uniref:SRPBCC family protein n=1 Tax=Xanthobacter TaxID=279 RepID=UPI001F1D4DED|nr:MULTISPECIES: SRPBCC family protein [unclassified Xanthobacter]